MIFVTLQNTSKVWILVSFSLQKNYIVENICVNRFEIIPMCNGKCYISNEMEEDEQHQKKFPELNNKEILQFFPPLVSIVKNTPLIACVPILLPNEVLCTSSEVSFSVFHPPRFSA